MNPRLSLLTFPQRYDGARLHVRILVVPRLDTEWSGDPLQPLIVDMPAPAIRPMRLLMRISSSRPAVLKGLDRFLAAWRLTWSRRCRTPAACGRSRARCSSRWWRRCPAGSSCLLAPRNWPGWPKIGSRSSKYLPRSYRESFVFTGPRATGAVPTTATTAR